MLNTRRPCNRPPSRDYIKTYAAALEIHHRCYHYFLLGNQDYITNNQGRITLLIFKEWTIFFMVSEKVEPNGLTKMKQISGCTLFCH